MPSPVRFPNGVTNVSSRDPLANYVMSDPSKLITYFDDFHLYTAANWTVTETAAGATQAVNTGARGGILELTQAASGATDVNQIQLINETFKHVSGKQLWLKARFALTAGTFANFGAAIGLAITDTTATAGVSDGIFFRKPTGGATLSAVLCKDSTETTISMGTMATATYVTAGLYYDGRGEVQAWLDGAKVGSTSTLTNLVDDEELAVTIASVNATGAAANVLSVDYLLIAQER